MPQCERLDARPPTFHLSRTLTVRAMKRTHGMQECHAAKEALGRPLLSGGLPVCRGCALRPALHAASSSVGAGAPALLRSGLSHPEAVELDGPTALRAESAGGLLEYVPGALIVHQLPAEPSRQRSGVRPAVAQHFEVRRARVRGP